MKTRLLTGPALDDALDDVARLRIAVFREWPYLYDGDLDYERNYLSAYRQSADALIVGAYDGDWLVGAATGAPLAAHASDFADAFDRTGYDLASIYYCAESVLLTSYRGRGLGHSFFDLRENHARTRGYDKICFCSVMRPEDHPLRPSSYFSLDRFWQKRGYAPLPGVIASFAWKDTNQKHETRKPLQFWLRQL